APPESFSKLPKTKNPLAFSRQRVWMSALCCRLLKPPRARIAAVMVMMAMVYAERHGPCQSIVILCYRQVPGLCCCWVTLNFFPLAKPTVKSFPLFRGGEKH